MTTSIAELPGLDRGLLTSTRLGRRVARRLVLAALERLERGRLRLIEAEAPAPLVFGAERPGEPTVTVRVADDRFWSKIAFGGSIGAAEAYMAGWWTADDLVAVVRLLVRNRELLDGLDAGWGRVTEPLHRLFHLLRANTRRGAKRNIVAHYDLGDDFFDLFLDRQRQYSSAVFERPGMSLDAAQEAKLDRICRKLALRPDDHLLEIGSGWGGLAVWAASRYGCRVTTTTISPTQRSAAIRRAEEAEVGDRVRVLERDWRDLDGRYDKLVSVEMIEAIGLDQISPFFRRSAELLAPTGLMLLQSITIADRFFERARRSVDFIQRYIFPGSAIPSIGSLVAAGARTDLSVIHLEDIGPSYAETLRHWRQRLFADPAAPALAGRSPAFRRLWDFYFAYCEGGFRERSIGDVQMVLAKPDARREEILGALGPPISSAAPGAAVERSKP